MEEARGSYLRAVFFKVLYVITIVTMLALIKGAADVPVTELMFFRCFFSIIPIAIWLAMQGELSPSAFRTTRLSAHITRTILGISAMSLTFFAVQRLPLPETITLQYSQPLFIVALSALFLVERVGMFRWGAVVFGFAGVLVITWPNLTLFSSEAGDFGTDQLLGAAAALAGSAGVAVVMLLVGELVKTEKPTTITLYFWLVSSVVMGMTAVTGWVMPTPLQLLVLVVCGILGGLGQLFMALHLKAAPASATAPLEYLSLLFATAIGYVFFGDVPGMNTLAGGAMVIAAGLTIIWREAKRGAKRPPKVLPPQ